MEPPCGPTNPSSVSAQGHEKVVCTCYMLIGIATGWQTSQQQRAFKVMVTSRNKSAVEIEAAGLVHKWCCVRPQVQRSSQNRPSSCHSHGGSSKGWNNESVWAVSPSPPTKLAARFTQGSRKGRPAPLPDKSSNNKCQCYNHAKHTHTHTSGLAHCTSGCGPQLAATVQAGCVSEAQRQPASTRLPRELDSSNVSSLPKNGVA